MTWDDEDDGGARALSLSAWRGVARYFAPYRGLMIAASAMMLVCSLADVAVPIYQRYIIDSFIVPSTTDGLGAAALLGAAVVLVQAAGTVLFTRAAIRIEMGFSRDLKKACFDHLQTLSISFYSTTPTGYLISRVMSDTDKIGLLVAWGLVDVMWGLSYVIFAAVAMTMLEPRLGAVMVVMLPVMAYVTARFQDRILRVNREVRRINSRVTGAFGECVMGAREAKGLACEDAITEQFSSLTERMRRMCVRSSAMNAVFMQVMMLFGSVAAAIMIVRGGGYVLDETLDFGTLSALVSYAISVFQPIMQLSRLLSEAASAQANVERVTALLEREPEIVDSPEVIARYGTSFEPKRENWEPLAGHITFDDVSFKYPDGDELVLDHFSLDVPAGTKVAIVGETGAGKSTIVNLVCRFYEPTSGRVLIDGRDSRERSQLWLRSNIGYVLQGPHLFSGTVRDNIRYARPDAGDDEVMAAARLAAADGVIARLPDGLDSLVGEGGDTLSTGEKQLISFARALLADPRIFVLDEATSSIDTETEALIQEASDRALGGRTSFVIAHRLSTITTADVILVVKAGRIAERGTHAELLASGGAYAHLVSMMRT